MSTNHSGTLVSESESHSEQEARSTGHFKQEVGCFLLLSPRHRRFPANQRVTRGAWWVLRGLVGSQRPWDGLWGDSPMISFAPKHHGPFTFFNCIVQIPFGFTVFFCLPCTILKYCTITITYFMHVNELYLLYLLRRGTETNANSISIFVLYIFGNWQ